MDQPRLVKDINQQPWDLADPLPVAAGSFVPAGGKLVFSTSNYADDGSLWITDGTPQGTAPLAVSICPSPCQSITPLAAPHGIALLRVESGTELLDKTVRLWRTDGTAAGTAPLTAPLADIKATLVDGSLPGTAVLYFVGCRAEEGCELWSSDGTNDGTRIVADLKPGPAGSNPHALTAWHGGLYFLADDGRGTGLWSTDDTAGGTVFVTSVQEGDHEEMLAATPSRLFFTVGANREELWATGGTAVSTLRTRAFDKVRRCQSESGCPFIQSLGVFGDQLFFTARDQKRKEDQYWSSDGTTAGTRRWLGFPSPGDSGNGLRVAATLRRVGTRWVLLAPARGAQSLWTSAADLGSASSLTGCEGGCPAVISFVGTEAHTGGLLFVGADSTYGQELWITDGTGAGTRRLTDACPGPCSGFADGGEPSPGAFSQGTFAVATPDPDNQRELWATDGTPEGTQRLATLAAGLGTWGGLTFFGSMAGSPARGEMWATDGTVAGTRQVAVLEHTAPGSDPLLAAVPRGAVLLAREGKSQYVWGSDGTPDGTRRLSDFDLGSDQAAFVAGFFAAGKLQFYEVGKILPGTGWAEELWRTDGTLEGTHVTRQFTPFQTLRLAADWNGQLLFQMEGPAAGQCGWWISDGTAAGTREILPFPHDIRCATGVQPFGSKFLFVASTGKARNFIPQLFVSDGTAAGTRQISRVRGSRDELDAGFVRIGGTAFFLIVSRAGLDTELWRTDGTPHGTRPAVKLPQPSRLFGFGGSLYLTAGVPGDPNAQLALWRVSLDSRSPVLLHTLRYGPHLSYTPLGDRLLFVADADEHGVELWGTDGTPEGTALVSDILPGEGSSMPTGLIAVGGKIFFSAHDGEHGWEPWESDGTAAGTRMVQDINPGSFSSAPSGFVLSGSTLFFAADDGVAGVEPWVLPLGPQGP
jgi:ELWxxDGT repeat protein